MTDKDHLNAIINAWEALPGGKRYEGSHGIRQVDNWLNEEMTPAIKAARIHLGRKLPNGR